MGLRDELFQKREKELQENQEPTVKEVVTEIEPIDEELLKSLDFSDIQIPDSTLDSFAKEWVKEQPYLSELPKAEPIKVIQLQQLFFPKVQVFIKPNNHKLYWEGEAKYIPVSFYDCEIRDMSLRRSFEEEPYNHGSVSIFIDKIEFWEEVSDKHELEEINEYYAENTEKKKPIR